MQQKETLNDPALQASLPESGRILAIDPGTKAVGLAISDPMRLIATPLESLHRKSWKKLLADVQKVIAEYDAAALVIGLPLDSDGGEGPMSIEARDMARKFELSLSIPVFLQDERVTTYEARKRLWDRGVLPEETKLSVDAEAAAIILSDFIEQTRR